MLQASIDQSPHVCCDIRKERVQGGHLPEVGHMIHRPGHEADRHLQSANHVARPTSKLVT